MAKRGQASEGNTSHDQTPLIILGLWLDFGPLAENSHFKPPGGGSARLLLAAFAQPRSTSLCSEGWHLCPDTLLQLLGGGGGRGEGFSQYLD